MTQEIQLPIVLKPCPFCGDSATVSYWGSETQIMCTNCNALSAAFSEPDAERRAIEAWNTRTTDATIQGLVRALEDVTELLCATVNEFGCWTPHDHPKVRAANEALKSVRGNG